MLHAQNKTTLHIKRNINDKVIDETHLMTYIIGGAIDVAYIFNVPKWPFTL